MPSYLLISLGAGLVSALLHASAATGAAAALMLIYFSPLPLFMAGLSFGPMAVSIAGIFATLAIAVAGGPQFATTYFLANAAAPILLCYYASRSRQYDTPNGPVTEWYPSGNLFGWLWVVGTVIVILLAFLAQSQSGGMRGWISQTLQVEQLATSVALAQLQAGGTAIDETVLQNTLIAFAAPGAAVFWMLTAIGNGALAQRLVTRLGRALRPSPRMLELVLPPVMVIPLAAGLALSFLPGDLGLASGAIAAMAAVPYFFLGLAVVHAISRGLPARGFTLGLFYILILTFGWPVLLTVGLGVADQFAGFRHRFITARAGKGREED